MKISILLLLSISLHALSIIKDIVVIQNSLKKRFLQQYPTLKIEEISIKPYRDKPDFLNSFTLEKIYLSKSNIKRAQGTISALYLKKNQKRKLYFRYQIKGRLGVYKANQTIKKDETISRTNTTFDYIPFTYISSMPIDSSYLDHYRAKYSLITDKVITQRDLKPIVDINRGDSLNATLLDGDVMVTFGVTALEEGNIGDIISVKRGHHKRLKAKIVSKNSVEILP